MWHCAATHGYIAQGSLTPALTALVMTTQVFDGEEMGVPIRQLVKVTGEVSDQVKEPLTCSSFIPSHAPAWVPVDTVSIHCQQ